ncbi:MAG: 50S ribosomal protein L18 [Methanocellales archaeon]
MAKVPRYKVKFRRRREGRTDYRRRLNLLLSKQPRLVIRKSLKHIRAQLVLQGERGDLTMASASSKELVKYGYRASTSNTPAAYLTGLLLGYRAKKAGFSNAILDIGLYSPSKGARVFAALKGALDAGLHIPHNESILPSEERIRGEHVNFSTPEFEEIKLRIAEKA